MTDKELKKLNRRELLEILIEQIKENERIRSELEEKNKQLEERSIKLDQAGNIAEAALQINNVFEAAQAAAEQYVQNVRNGDGAADADYSEIEHARTEAERIIAEAQRESEAIKERAAAENGQTVKENTALTESREYRYLLRFYKKYKWIADIID